MIYIEGGMDITNIQKMAEKRNIKGLSMHNILLNEIGGTDEFEMKLT